MPFIRDAENVLTVDRIGADWSLVPLTQLGSHVTVVEHPSRTGAHLVAGVPNESKGGPVMQPVKVTSKMYAAAAMTKVKVKVGDMKVTQLKEELQSRKYIPQWERRHT